MKTPMQELIEHLETWVLDDKYVQDNPMKYEEYMVHHANQMVQVKEHFIRLCKSMLEKEKQMIIDAANDGCWLSGYCYIDKSREGQEYYNKTFNTED